MRNLEDSDVSNLVSDSRRNFSRVAEAAAERFIVHCERSQSVSKVRQASWGGGERKGFPDPRNCRVLFPLAAIAWRLISRRTARERFERAANAPRDVRRERTRNSLLINQYSVHLSCDM